MSHSCACASPSACMPRGLTPSSGCDAGRLAVCHHRKAWGFGVKRLSLQPCAALRLAGCSKDTDHENTVKIVRSLSDQPLCRAAFVGSTTCSSAMRARKRTLRCGSAATSASAATRRSSTSAICGIILHVPAWLRCFWRPAGLLCYVVRLLAHCEVMPRAKSLRCILHGLQVRRSCASRDGVCLARCQRRAGRHHD